MAATEQLTDDIYRLEGRIPGVDAVFAVYFIRDGGGAIIEPGPARLVPDIHKAAAELGITQPEYIIPTHIHLDHAGGAGKLAEIFPSARVALVRQGAKHMAEPTRLIESTKMAFGDGFEETYGAILPVPEAQLTIVKDGDELELGSRKLLVVHSPGHASHHIAIFDSKTKGLFCGEAAGLVYSPDYPPLPAVAPPGFDLELYLRDMDNLKALKPRLLFYSHGTVAQDPAKLIDQARENSQLVGDFILKELKAGKSDRVIADRVREYLLEKFNATLDEYELVTNVNGYIYYFRKKGLV